MNTAITGASGPYAQAKASDTGALPRVAGGQLGKDEFLRLLTAQLANQDPLDPMDGKEMAADLAQFSSLEQMLNMTKAIESQQVQMGALVQAMNNTSALAAVGRNVVVDSDRLVLTNDATGAPTASVMADVTTSGVATLTLLDQSGREVGSRSLGFVSVGNQQHFDVGPAATGLPEGAYQFRITVADGSGKDVPQQTYAVGRIDGLAYGADGNALLTMGPLTIAYNAIARILA